MYVNIKPSTLVYDGHFDTRSSRPNNCLAICSPLYIGGIFGSYKILCKIWLWSLYCGLLLRSVHKGNGGILLRTLCTPQCLIIYFSVIFVRTLVTIRYTNLWWGAGFVDIYFTYYYNNYRLGITKKLKLIKYNLL